MGLVIVFRSVAHWLTTYRLSSESARMPFMRSQCTSVAGVHDVHAVHCWCEWRAAVRNRLFQRRRSTVSAEWIERPQLFPILFL